MCGGAGDREAGGSGAMAGRGRWAGCRMVARHGGERGDGFAVRRLWIYWEAGTDMVQDARSAAHECGGQAL